MRFGLLQGVCGFILAYSSPVYAQCPQHANIEGIITDPTGSLVPGAEITGAGRSAQSDAAGRFVLTCVAPGTAFLSVHATGFAPATASVLVQASRSAHADFQLSIAAQETEVQVTGDDDLATTSSSDTTVLSSRQVDQLPDDPDDLLRRLQLLSASAGGSASSARITVDGFQNGSVLPPKGTIASVKINPDLFSSQYAWPPFNRGLIEITTKPGGARWHGALFYTGSNGRFNATDPFSETSTPAGKQRYGFELGGPVVPEKSDLALALEKRDIDEFRVVRAITLAADGSPAPLLLTVSAPQRLWSASASGGWQLSAKDVARISFSASNNSLGNQGIGGLILPEAGYGSVAREFDLHISNAQVLSANLVHETLLGYTWKRSQQTPDSTAPALEVAGYFNGGGSTSGDLNDRERDLEVDDDVLVTHGTHSLKLGVQALALFVHDVTPDTFNGAFIFGGGSAPSLAEPSQTTTISGLEQYRRALSHLPGGAPTTYQQNSGTALVPFTQWRVALYASDTRQLAPRLTLASGVRYQMQTSPCNVFNLEPRLGLSWALDRRSKWILRLHAGLFNFATDVGVSTEVYRFSGNRQVQTTVYSPSFGNPRTPAPGSIEVATSKQFAPRFSEGDTFGGDAQLEHHLPHGWVSSASFYWGEDWNRVRLLNINAPLVATSIGAPVDPLAALRAPRPLAPGRNILEYQNAAHLSGSVVHLGVEQHSFKRLDISVHYRHLNFHDDSAENFSSPQSSYSNAGESARPEWQATNGLSVLVNANLPGKLELSGQFDAMSGFPYNVTTGLDANGDGNFNDRPAFARTLGAGTYSTPFGLLTTNAVNGNIPRNAGTMPALFHLDANLSRSFVLNPRKKEHSRSLVLNVRGANVLNHTNVTAVGTVISSPNVGQGISAEAARRVEIGARLTF